ncbi:Rv0909 family putative TA system antitoxin [Kocuria sp. CPCC 205263]
MPDLGGAADKAKDYAQDNPEKVDQGKDKAKDALNGKNDGDQQ